MGTLLESRAPVETGMIERVFVYGTLKEGFPNFFRNAGRRVTGSFRTRLAFPFYVVQLVNEGRAPWLVNTPGQGHRVTGQVFEVDGATLQAMDVFEEVGLPSGYERVAVDLEPLDAVATEWRAYAYMKQVHQLNECLAIEGPFPEYTRELAEGYWLAAS